MAKTAFQGRGNGFDSLSGDQSPTCYGVQPKIFRNWVVPQFWKSLVDLQSVALALLGCDEPAMEGCPELHPAAVALHGCVLYADTAWLRTLGEGGS